MNTQSDNDGTWSVPVRSRSCVLGILGIAILCMTAFVVRLAYVEDISDSFDTVMPAQTFISHRRALSMLEGGGLLLWDDQDPSKLKQIRRPPGYAIFLTGTYLVVGADLRRAQVVQAFLDSLVVAGLALVGWRLSGWTAGLVAGGLYAISPHQAYYSILVTPDAPVAWPVLMGTGLVFIATRRGGRAGLIAATLGGSLLGVSCWLTAQGMTLPLFLGAVLVATASKEARRYAMAAAGLAILASAVVVAPLTIRNIAVYGTLAPIRPGLGTTLLEGIGVYDSNYPATDGALLSDEAARFGRPDYEQALYQPDGLIRERDRMERALSVIGDRPAWFASIMVDRLGLIFSYATSGDRPWPWNSAVVSPVASEGDLVKPPVRRLLGIFQSTIFHTWVIRLAALCGIVALLATRRWRETLWIWSVPIHHGLIGSVVLTEYKYALPIHAWVFLTCGALVGIGVLKLRSRRETSISPPPDL